MNSLMCDYQIVMHFFELFAIPQGAFINDVIQVRGVGHSGQWSEKSETEQRADVCHLILVLCYRVFIDNWKFFVDW